MIPFANQLLDQISEQLSEIHASDILPRESAIRAMEVLAPALLALNEQFDRTGFASAEDEIRFFKALRPQLLSKVIYYSSILQFETDSGNGGKARRSHARRELRQLRHFRETHIAFYRYYRSGATDLDRHYFLRGADGSRLVPDRWLMVNDVRSSPTYDFLAARLLAQDLLETYFDQVIAEAKYQRPVTLPNAATLRWTAPKVALVELLYALHAEGVFNDGKADLKAVAECFEKMFHVRLGHFNRIFVDLRARKTDRVRFLDLLRERLLKRMDDADEVA